ncbi:MAG: carboxymuconolactone decarboxylase family protein [Calditrichaeota bacterium]|nr:MAG: carboxymuconolactone decarboxylase family protein [Calditrichota bacterium]
MKNILAKAQKYFTNSELDFEQRMLNLISSTSALALHTDLKEVLNFTKEKDIPYTKIYEVILQNYLFAGFPAGIEGMICLYEVFPNEEKPKFENPYKNYDKTLADGEALCQKVYGKNFGKLIEHFEKLCPELAEWMIFEGYGKTLSRKGLTVIERELCAVSTLAVLSWKRQLISHLKGARNVGATEVQIKETILQTSVFLPKEIIENYLKLILG